MCVDFLFQKTPIINSKERTVQSGDAFEDTAFKRGFEIVSQITDNGNQPS
jgi:hypothetical protein